MKRTREELFSILVREHEVGLLGFVRACVHDPADAEDLVQETFVAAWRQLDQYDPERPFAGWVRGIAKNKILAYLRSRVSDRRHVRILSPQAVAAIADEFERLNRPPRRESYSDCFGALRECLAALGKEDQEIVRRAYRENQTCRAIADQVGKTLEAVKKRLQRARAQLRDCILGKLGTETPNG